MRSTRTLAFAALVALPVMGTAAGAAPAAPTTGNALSKIDAGSHVVDVRKGGGGGMRMGRMGGGRAFKGGGGGPRFAMKGGGPRIAGFRSRGSGRHWHGGHGHWRGGHGHHHHHHHHFRPRWYGVPYYYDYAPSYYYDDYYDDDYDDAVVYANDGDAVERCEARYRSFDRRSGTFLGNDGRRHLCPYLR